jgi:hypothetical protein
MTNPTPVPLGQAGDPDARPADNDLRAVTIAARVRLRGRVGIAADAETYRLTSYASLDPTLLRGTLRVEVEQLTGGLEIVTSDPDAAEDLAAALTWAAARLRDLHTLAEPAKDRRTFGLAEPPRPARQARAAATPAATKEAA